MWDPNRTVALLTLLEQGTMWKMSYVDRLTLEPGAYRIADCLGAGVAIPVTQERMFQQRVLYYHVHSQGGRRLMLWTIHNGPAGSSDPGLVPLSHDKLRRFCPFLYAPPNPERAWSALVIREIARQLWDGDSRAALVAVLRPLTVAAYSDELDAVILLRFPSELVEEYGLEAGTRLLSTNFYNKSGAAPGEIEPGPAASGRWTQFNPQIAEFLSDDRRRIEQRKAGIAEAEWRRCAECAAGALRRRAVARDGRYSNSLLQLPFWSPTPVTQG